MSNKWTRLMAVATVTAGLALAQGPGFPRGGDAPGSPQDAQQRRLNFLATFLGLTDSQKEQAKSTFDAADQASQPVRDQLTQAHQALRDAVKTNKTDTQIDQLAAALGVLEGQMAAIQTKAHAKFYALLTPEQRDKLDQVPGPGGPGGPGGGFGGRQFRQRR